MTLAPHSYLLPWSLVHLVNPILRLLSPRDRRPEHRLSMDVSALSRSTLSCGASRRERSLAPVRLMLDYATMREVFSFDFLLANG
jgi:hypothetical protein